MKINKVGIFFESATIQLIFGENIQSNYFVVTNLQDKKIDKFKSFNKEDWSSAYQNVEKELTKEPLKISKGNNIKNLNGTLLRLSLIHI